MNLKGIQSEIDKERKENPKIKLLIYWAVLSLLGITIIKTVIRPNNYHFSRSFDFLQGTLPNFFAGAMMFVAGYIIYRGVLGKKVVKNRRILFAFLFSFCGLVLWEIIQFYMGYPIDLYDIIMTAIGNLLTIVIIRIFKI